MAEFLEKFRDVDSTICAEKLVSDSMDYISLTARQISMRAESIDEDDKDDMEALLADTARDMREFNEVCLYNKKDPVFTGDLHDDRNVNAQLMQMTDAFLAEGQKKFAEQKGSTAVYQTDGSLTDKVENLSTHVYRIEEHTESYKPVEGFRYDMEHISSAMVSLGGSGNTSWQKDRISEDIGTMKEDINGMNDASRKMKLEPVFIGDLQNEAVLGSFAAQYARENMRDWQNQYDSEMGYERIADKVLGKQEGTDDKREAAPEQAKETLAITVTEKQVFDFKNDDDKKIVSIRDSHSASGFGSFIVDADAVQDAGQTKKGTALKSVKLDPERTYSVSEQRGKGDSKYFYHKNLSGQEVAALYAEGMQAASEKAAKRAAERTAEKPVRTHDPKVEGRRKMPDTRWIEEDIYSIDKPLFF